MSHNIKNAIVIMNQLGGNLFCTMIGVKKIMAVENGVIFNVTTNKLKCNYVQVTLNGSDLYDIQYLSIRAGKRTVKHEDNNVYAEDMIELFEQNTGLYAYL